MVPNGVKLTLRWWCPVLSPQPITCVSVFISIRVKQWQNIPVDPDQIFILILWLFVEFFHQFVHDVDTRDGGDPLAGVDACELNNHVFKTISSFVNTFYIKYGIMQCTPHVRITLGQQLLILISV